MRNALKTGSLLLVLALFGGCTAAKASLTKRGTLSCSCGATDCECSHCTGKTADCRCRATDAYPDGRVGTPDGY